MHSPERAPKGRLIVIEGADGCGKSTQADLLCEHLRHRRLPAVLLREPGGSRIGEEVRRVLLDPANRAMSVKTELLLYMACRGQLAHEVIRPALAEGKYVVCDRFLLSSVVYQGFACGLGVELVWEMGEFATGGLRPDVQIVLGVSYESARARRRTESDRIEARGEGFHRAVIEGYLEVARGLPSTHIIDGDRSVEEVRDDILRTVEREIG